MSADEREPGEAYCATCPDHEACFMGYPCDLVKRLHVDHHRPEPEETP